METQPNKCGRDPRKQLEEHKNVGDSSRGPVLTAKANTPIPFRLGIQRLDVRRTKGPVDVVFQELLENANEELARLLRAVRRGPQSGRLRRTDSRQSSDLLVRAVQCAAKQYMVQAELGILALQDELTGCYNRRGFYALAERQLKLGRRSGREMLLFFFDIDRLKQINDSHGHAAGDRALKRAADTLKKTFRDSDVIARLGGDEFAVLAIEASGHSEMTIMSRLNKYLGAGNDSEGQCRVSLSVGVARFDHHNPAPIVELIAQADQAMYKHKRGQPSFRTAEARISACSRL